MQRMVRLVVTGVTEKHGQAWDLVCQADGIGTITVDPFVSCAWPAGTDADRRAMALPSSVEVCSASGGGHRQSAGDEAGGGADANRC